MIALVLQPKNTIDKATYNSSAPSNFVTTSHPHPSITSRAPSMTKRKRSQDDDEGSVAPFGRFNTTIQLDDDQRNTEPSGFEENPFNIDEEAQDDDLGEVIFIDRYDSGDIPAGHTVVPSAKLSRETLHLGSRVELYDGDFLKITRIYLKQANGQHVIQGNLMRRTNKAQGMLPRKLNEIYYVLQTTMSNQNPTLKDCLVTRPLADVKCVREIVITNQKYPHLSWRDDYKYKPQHSQLSRGEMAAISDKMRLVCRWFVTEELNGKSRIGGSVRSVTEEDADEGAHIPCAESLRNFLGKKRTKFLAGTHATRLEADEEKFVTQLQTPSMEVVRPASRMQGHEVIDLTDDASVKSIQYEIKNTIARINSQGGSSGSSTTKKATKSPNDTSIKNHFNTSKTNFSPHGSGQRYGSGHKAHTYGDLCAGAGGTATGAQQAGLKVQFLLDHWDIACDTLRMNFPGAAVLHEDIHSFCMRDHRWLSEIVDILHISFPCQPHSRRNFYDRDHGHNPDNIAVGFSTKEILERCKPRIVTFEQTSHIITKNNGDFFRVIVNHLTDMQYNVRWRICNCADYNNAHARKRLVIIASCPGEQLPTFPEPTNGVGPGKKPYMTIRKVLQRVETYKNHNGRNVPNVMQSSEAKHEPSYNADAPLKLCITCDGGKNVHPSGHRTFTPLELAALQAFRLDHKFAGSKSQIIKQIGNAVPSCFAKILFEHITKALRESDKSLAASIAASKAKADSEAIELD